jgi:mannose-6-phosphate isomerase-like protein (cupin superfamily)
VASAAFRQPKPSAALAVAPPDRTAQAAATRSGDHLVKLPALPFHAVHWDALPATEHPGETGTALWRTMTNGDVRMRVVEYSPGYVADHWCDRGHVLYVIEGELKTELKDGRQFTFGPGEGYTVSDFGDAAHRSSTQHGARLFIVD